MIDKLTTVRRANAGKVIGRIDECQLVEIERPLMLFRACWLTRIRIVDPP